MATKILKKWGQSRSEEDLTSSRRNLKQWSISSYTVSPGLRGSIVFKGGTMVSGFESRAFTYIYRELQ